VAVEADVAYLKGLTDLAGGGLRGLMAAIATPYLERYLGGFSKYALRALEYGGRLVARDKPPRGKKSAGAMGRDPGREVVFPVRRSPRFLLQNLSASVSAQGEAYSARFTLRNLSSDPQLTGAPVSAAAEVDRENRGLVVSGSLDLRQRAPERVSAALEAFGQPLELSDGLEAVNLRQLRGRLDIRTDLSLAEAGTLSGAGRLALREMALATAGKADALSAAIYDTLNSAPELLMDFRFASEGQGGRLRVSAATNLDDMLAARLKDSLASLAAQQEQQLRGELQRRLEPQLARNADLNASLSGLQAQTGGDLQNIAGYDRLLAQKRSELEARLKKLGGGLLKSLPLP
jgi:hypothetical protein